MTTLRIEPHVSEAFATCERPYIGPTYPKLCQELINAATEKARAEAAVYRDARNAWQERWADLRGVIDELTEERNRLEDVVGQLETEVSMLQHRYNDDAVWRGEARHALGHVEDCDDNCLACRAMARRTLQMETTGG